MNSYKALSNQTFSDQSFKIVPIRLEDRMEIMKWRNEQIYHLRQAKPLTEEDQHNYFNQVIFKLFEQERPHQILFSLLKDDVCIGYGGLVHINWIDKHAEISFIMDTSLEKDFFHEIWTAYLKLIEEVSFGDLRFHKIFTYAFDLRKHLYEVLEKNNFYREAILKDHCCYQNKMIDVHIHSKLNKRTYLSKATIQDCCLTYNWANNTDIRKYSFSTDIIPLENHQNWFSQKLTDPDCDYHILKQGGHSVGSIRIDYDKSHSTGLISYLIDPQFQGQGFGKKILELVEKSIESKLTVYEFTLAGFVKDENIASIKIFKNLNYIETEHNNGVIKFEKKITHENSK